MTTEDLSGIGTERRDEPVPELPHVYALIRCDVVDSAVDEARRRARQGAEEGTFVWAQQQTAARDGFGRPQPSPRGNLYGCLILRPEHPLEIALQLNCVAVISLGLTIAELAPPMTELRYRWPNAILLNGATVGDIVLEAGPRSPGIFEWLLLGVTVNVKHRTATSGSDETCLETEGADSATAAGLLEGFSRHFLSWINRWAEAGFAPVHKVWAQRVDGLGGTQAIQLKEETVNGRLIELDDRGALVLELQDHVRRRLTIAEYFGIREE